MPNYYTVLEFAELKNTTKQTIYNAIKNGSVNSVKIYGKTLITKCKKNDSWLPMESKKRF